MSAARAGGRYRSLGQWHEVLVTRDPCGRWQILDATRSELVVVETLTGHDDRLDQALAVARDYAAEQNAFQHGSRDDDPLPRPVRIDRAAGAGPKRSRLNARNESAAPAARYEHAPQSHDGVAVPSPKRSPVAMQR